MFVSQKKTQRDSQGYSAGFLKLWFQNHLKTLKEINGYCFQCRRLLIWHKLQWEYGVPWNKRPVSFCLLIQTNASNPFLLICISMSFISIWVTICCHVQCSANWVGAEKDSRLRRVKKDAKVKKQRLYLTIKLYFHEKLLHHRHRAK